tara:strand:+ start:27972 stop:31151 length:3180 start_codon:yes stop_codon:yes gene_type:complete
MPDISKKDVILGRVVYYKTVISKTILAIQKYKLMEVLTHNDYNLGIANLEKNNEIIHSLELALNTTNTITDAHINILQEINDNLSMVCKNYGTESIEDILCICFGTSFIKNWFPNINQTKYAILNKYFHPIGYKLISCTKTRQVKPIEKNKIIDESKIEEFAEDLECFDLARTNKKFKIRLLGMKVAVFHKEKKSMLILNGIVDDMIMSCIYNDYITEKRNNLYSIITKESDVVHYKEYVKTIILKEWLVYNENELFHKFKGYDSQLKLLKQKSITQVINEFINSDLYSQRMLLILMLSRMNVENFKYLAYLLYDLLSNDVNGTIDSIDQKMLYDSLPWYIKTNFKIAMTETIDYTNNLIKFEQNKIPLEQQICLLKTTDAIKEKAMSKLREIKAKSEDSGSKSRQYLDGLLRIPFGIYRKEEILSITQTTKDIFKNLILDINTLNILNLDYEYSYNILELKKNITQVNKIIGVENILTLLKKSIIKMTKNQLVKLITYINNIIKTDSLNVVKIVYSSKKINEIRTLLMDFINTNTTVIDIHYWRRIYYMDNHSNITSIEQNITQINTNQLTIKNYFSNVKNTLEDSVYGHKDAKRQIERIIGQWVNGEQTGYCFGFEGPPGVGKTSLALNGISKCLIDSDGSARPFSIIAMGGSSNGSTLEGHNYTYVGSTWGKIVDIIMEKKCMNPIIFIDELDKVSKTEHGREIIGILTHLIDKTQNTHFQDRYFTGIDLDLSKALFIFSYNDVSLIDRILLDRIHRVKFDYLSLQDKIVIVKKYILPETYKQMGLENTIYIDDDLIEYIIEEYTNEPGVRKLKQLIFDIVGEINLEVLNNNTDDCNIPIHVTKDMLINKYLSHYTPYEPQKISLESEVGVINGLWANSMGNGGIIPIQVRYFITNNFHELKLTGMQGDVMKESMNVAKTLACSLAKTSGVTKKMITDKLQGIHIHCPDGAVPKDGPSAGAAITTAIYSLILNKKINHLYGITGEINLQGNVTKIGGLDLKIVGGIRGGVKHFLFPYENIEDYNKFLEKNKNNKLLEGISFKPVKTIHDVLGNILV